MVGVRGACGRGSRLRGAVGDAPTSQVWGERRRERGTKAEAHGSPHERGSWRRGSQQGDRRSSGTPGRRGVPEDGATGATLAGAGRG